MHVLLVTDPWFGPYIRVHANSPDLYGFTTVFTVGPLFVRCMRLESLENRGKRYTLGDFKEKPCQHSYVEGLVSGDVSDETPASGSGIILLPISHSGHTEDLNPGPGMGFDFRTEYDFVWSESANGCAFSFDVKYLYRMGEEPWHVYCIEHVEASAQKVTDEVTSNVIYTGFRIRDSWRLKDEVKTSNYHSLVDCPCPYSTGPDSLGTSLSSLFQFATEELAKCSEAKPSNSTRDIAIYAALDDLKISDINPIETIKDLAEPLAAIRQIVGFFRPVGGLPDLLKRFANLHLWWKYVVKTGILSAGEFRKLAKFLVSRHENVLAMFNNLLMIGHGHTSKTVSVDGLNATVVYSAKVCYTADTTTLNGLLDTLNMLRMTPRLVDLWDIVPYSFVVDWLIPVSDYMDHLEEMNTQQRVPFNYMILSWKTVIESKRSLRIGNHTFNVDLRFVNYDRSVLDEFPPDVGLGLSLPGHPERHLVTGGALIVQR